jgi:hypothetical protein
MSRVRGTGVPPVVDSPTASWHGRPARGGESHRGTGVPPVVDSPTASWHGRSARGG